MSDLKTNKKFSGYKKTSKMEVVTRISKKYYNAFEYQGENIQNLKMYTYDGIIISLSDRAQNYIACDMCEEGAYVKVSGLFRIKNNAKTDKVYIELSPRKFDVITKEEHQYLIFGNTKKPVADAEISGMFEETKEETTTEEIPF